MNLTTAPLQWTIELGFRSACAELAQAQRAHGAKDTPAARARLRECAERLDALLDVFNDLARSR